MNAPNGSQISGAADRVVIAGLVYLASKGYITSADVANLATMIVTILGAVYAYYINRNTNLAKQAASIPGTTIITTPEIAAATPDLSNVVSNTDTKVVSK